MTRLETWDRDCCRRERQQRRQMIRLLWGSACLVLAICLAMLLWLLFGWGGGCVGGWLGAVLLPSQD